MGLFNGTGQTIKSPPGYCEWMRKKSIDKNNIIKKQPLFLCEYCFKEDCKGHGLTKVINFIKSFIL